MRVSAGSQTPSGSSMSPFRVPSPQLSDHVLSSTLYPLRGYQQIPTVYTRRTQGDWTGIDEGRGGSEKGKEWLAIPYCRIKRGFVMQEAGSPLAHLIGRAIRTMG